VGSVDVTTIGGTTGQLAKFTGASTIGNAPIYVTSGGNIGVGVTSPTFGLEVNGTAGFLGQTTFDQAINLAPLGTATPRQGEPSASLTLEASTYGSVPSASFLQKFTWQAVPVGNDSILPSSALELIFAAGTDAPKATGLSIAPTGKFTFAPGQTFPGAVTGVTAGAGLIGGGTSGGALTLSVDQTKIPTLAGNNTFTGNQTFSGVLNATDVINASGEINTFALNSTGGVTSPSFNAGSAFYLNGSLFAFGSPTARDAYLGFSGSQSSTGSYNTGLGDLALKANTTGSSNTAEGAGALGSNTNGAQNVANGASALAANQGGSYNTADGVYALSVSKSGAYNTAVGYAALNQSVSGSLNTAIGAGAGPDPSSTSLAGSTAIGANSIVSQDHSLILGATTAGQPGASFVNVGVGTATPVSAMEISVNNASGVGPALTLTNPGGAAGNNASAAIDFNTLPISSAGTYNPGARIEAITDDSAVGNGSTDLVFLASKPGAQNSGMSQIMSVGPHGVEVGGIPGGTVAGLSAVGATAQDGIVGYGGAPSGNVAPGGVIGFGANNYTSSAFTYGGGPGGYFVGGDSPYLTDSIGVWAVGGENKTGERGYAGYFEGDLVASGTIESLSNDNVIDAPADPANKTLVHAGVESSERMNIYTGNAVTDELGVARVDLPEWFETLNTDYRYQLTVIGRKANAWISEEVKDGHFSISSDATNTKISWQITAVRQDAWAKAHPLVVERQKPERERGFYQHPELYGLPEDKQIEWARNPAMMQRLKEHRAEGERKTHEPARAAASSVPSGPASSAATKKFAPAVSSKE
jgi:hypothetical protein